ncbi:MAG: bis-aminopropyl spermidine synthase family protein [Minisyncoccia bacterium]
MEEEIKKFLEKYEKIRPKPERALDQFRAREETLFRRALLLSKIPNIEDKNLLFLGDADLTSIIFSKYFKAKKVAVVDIDKKVLEFIKYVSENENFDIEVYEYDLREPLDKKIFYDYDVVFFDPPYTGRAVNVWLIRAMEASLGKGSNKKRKSYEFLNKKFYLMCFMYTDKNLEKGLEVQRIISKLGLVIQEKYRGFNEYYGAKTIGNKSDLYIIQPTPEINLALIDTRKKGFYTYE